MSVNATNVANLNKYTIATETLKNTGIVTDDSKDRISDLRSNLGLGEYDNNGRAMVPGTIYKDKSQHGTVA